MHGTLNVLFKSGLIQAMLIVGVRLRALAYAQNLEVVVESLDSDLDICGAHPDFQEVHRRTEILVNTSPSSEKALGGGQNRFRFTHRMGKHADLRPETHCQRDKFQTCRSGCVTMVSKDVDDDRSVQIDR
ncbi:hypothetical protein B1729_03545 [Microbacterium sp. B35-04]|nr:hypothetical protein B1729_03545 [Microbacterium sp. B35-04]